MGNTLLETPEPAWAAKHIPQPDPGDWELWFDGLCEPQNPGGVMTYGWVIKDAKGLLRPGSGHTLGAPKNTNNFAEYLALGHGLATVIGMLVDGHTFKSLMIYGDSALVINQLIGDWNCNHPVLVKLRDRCRDLLNGNSLNWSAEWVPREKNTEADALARERYRSVTGREPPERGKRGAR